MTRRDRFRYVLTSRGFWNPIALLRALWRIGVRGYETEVCALCGRPVGVVWTAPDGLWHLVIGNPGSVLCPGCFDALVREYGILLRWVPHPLDIEDAMKIRHHVGLATGRETNKTITVDAITTVARPDDDGMATKRSRWGAG